MKKFVNYLKETYTELVHKVSWPTWADLQGSSVLVLVASLIIALIVFAMDFSFDNLFKFIYKIF
ncbi:protein translocase subunit SecE [Bacteroidia bacterium]|nr:protein translocase subunit SecE [Bacteroidia bacterium]